MSFTSPQKADLNLIKQHGAQRIHNSHRMGDYTWRSGGKAIGATINALAKKGAVVIQGDYATITPLGERVIAEKERSRKAGSSHVNARIRAERVASRAA